MACGRIKDGLRKQNGTPKTAPLFGDLTIKFDRVNHVSEEEGGDQPHPFPIEIRDRCQGLFGGLHQIIRERASASNPRLFPPARKHGGILPDERDRLRSRLRPRGRATRETDSCRGYRTMRENAGFHSLVKTTAAVDPPNPRFTLSAAEI